LQNLDPLIVGVEALCRSGREADQAGAETWQRVDPGRSSPRLPALCCPSISIHAHVVTFVAFKRA
jgi:hypothetical protein